MCIQTRDIGLQTQKGDLGTPCIFECDRNEGEDAQENCSLFLTVWHLWEPNRQLILTGIMVMRQGVEIYINSITPVPKICPRLKSDSKSKS